VDTAEWQLANLEKGLESTLNIVWNEIKYKAKIKKDYAGIPDIECLAPQLNQVFLNLVINAAQAIDERGVIILRTGFDEHEVWVEVGDTGKGIEPEDMDKIFDPFFTTKADGQRNRSRPVTGQQHCSPPWRATGDAQQTGQRKRVSRHLAAQPLAQQRSFLNLPPTSAARKLPLSALPSAHLRPPLWTPA
jgi:hypothetical protein